MYSAGAFGGSSKPFDTSKFGGNTSRGALKTPAFKIN